MISENNKGFIKYANLDEMLHGVKDGVRIGTIQYEQNLLLKWKKDRPYGGEKTSSFYIPYNLFKGTKDAHLVLCENIEYNSSQLTTIELLSGLGVELEQGFISITNYDNILNKKIRQFTISTNEPSSGSCWEYTIQINYGSRVSSDVDKPFSDYLELRVSNWDRETMEKIDTKPIVKRGWATSEINLPADKLIDSINKQYLEAIKPTSAKRWTDSMAYVYSDKLNSCFQPTIYDIFEDMQTRNRKELVRYMDIECSILPLLNVLKDIREQYQNAEVIPTEEYKNIKSVKITIDKNHKLTTRSIDIDVYHGRIVSGSSLFNLINDTDFDSLTKEIADEYQKFHEEYREPLEKIKRALIFSKKIPIEVEIGLDAKYQKIQAEMRRRDANLFIGT